LISAVRIETTNCPGDQLNLLITLNGIDRNYVHLGDGNCKPIWSNETHAEFVTHVDNCSLVLTCFYNNFRCLMLRKISARLE